MPTKKKRVGFIPREEVMKIISKLSIENNLSNSKIINILVEEALSIRGIFNKKTGKENLSYNDINEFSKYLDENSDDSIDNKRSTINTKLENYKNSDKRNLFKQIKQDDIDLQTYKKFLLFLKFQEMIEKYNS
tara:strand:+ start:184 stop:582 length:399 start_codon:yes stop_codon:yes gene_type:complete